LFDCVLADIEMCSDIDFNCTARTLCYTVAVLPTLWPYYPHCGHITQCTILNKRMQMKPRDPFVKVIEFH